jgi:ribosome biogenesis GTPase
MRTSDDQGVIEAIQPRTSLLYRSNEIRQKLIAANVDQLVIVVATEPAFSDELVARALLAAESEEIEPLIVLNKCDLIDKLPAARAQLAVLRRTRLPHLELSACDHAEDLRPDLQGKTSVLVGQSGMGKSTLVNALVPEANAATREISQALDSGKHTTTHATLYHLDADSQLIDSPGLQEFGLGHLDRQEIETPSANSAPISASAASAIVAMTANRTAR